MRLAVALVIFAVFAQAEYEVDINGIKQMCSILGSAGKCVVLGPAEVVTTVIFAKGASELGENGRLIAPATFGPGSTVTSRFGTKVELLLFEVYKMENSSEWRAGVIDKTKNKATFMTLKDVKSVPNARPVPEHLASAAKKRERASPCARSCTRPQLRPGAGRPGSPRHRHQLKRKYSHGIRGNSPRRNR